MKKKILHLVTQRNQPFGSRRKCCERCGLGIHAMESPTRSTMPVGHSYVDEEANFTKEFAAKWNEVRCEDED